MKIENKLKDAVVDAVGKLYDVDIKSGSVQLSLTRKDQKGDFTIVVFPGRNCVIKCTICTAGCRCGW